MTEVSGHKYHTLDAMRGVAAIVVMLGHIKVLPVNDANFYSSYLAVDLFFLLSGFVIARAYGERLAEGLSPVTFMAMRLIRLWPMIALGVAIGGLRYALLPSPLDDLHGAAAVASVTVLNAVFLPIPPIGRHVLFPIDDPEWSLFYELVINLAFALGAYRLRGRRIGAVLGASGVLLLALSLHYHGINAGWIATQYPAGMVRVTFSFGLGALLYRHRERLLALVPRVPGPVLLLATAALLAVPGAAWWRAFYDVAFVVVAAPALILCGARVEPGARWRRVAIWLGEISYPLYAIHFAFVRMLDTVATTRHELAAALVSVGLLAACAPIARYYDAPARAWLTRHSRRFLPVRTVAAASGAAAPAS